MRVPMADCKAWIAAALCGGVLAAAGCHRGVETGAAKRPVVGVSLLTQTHLRSDVKGQIAVTWNELPQFAGGLVALLNQRSSAYAQRLLDSLGQENVYVEIQRHFVRGEERRTSRAVARKKRRILRLEDGYLASRAAHGPPTSASP